MKRAAILALVALALSVAPAEARKRHQQRHKPVTVEWSFAGSSLISEMRRYVGGNPTGWGRRWCGKFLDMALRRTGHAPGSNLAFGYRHYGRPAAGPCVGCIAVFRHSHVAVMTGYDANGNPVFISGNDGRRVRERARSMRGIIAWRVP